MSPSAAKCYIETTAHLMQIQTLYMAYADNYKAEYIILHHTVSTVHLAKSLKLFSNVLCIHKGNAFLQEILC